MKKTIIFITMVLLITACTFCYFNLKNEQVKKSITEIENKISNVKEKNELAIYYQKEITEIQNLTISKENLENNNNDLEIVLKEKENAINDYKNKISDLNNS